MNYAEQLLKNIYKYNILFFVKFLGEIKKHIGPRVYSKYRFSSNAIFLKYVTKISLYLLEYLITLTTLGIARCTSAFIKEITSSDCFCPYWL